MSEQLPNHTPEQMAQVFEAHADRSDEQIEHLEGVLEQLRSGKRNAELLEMIGYTEPSLTKLLANNDQIAATLRWCAKRLREEVESSLPLKVYCANRIIAQFEDETNRKYYLSTQSKERIGSYWEYTAEPLPDDELERRRVLENSR
jgi:hypothetical protein